MENSRTTNSIFNALSALFTYFVKYVLAFLVRTVFIKELGATYLGVNGLLTNVLSMLSLAELGIGTAISFNLYKPLVENDNKKISSLMTFYKKAYNIIGMVVACIGTVLFFFLDVIIKDAENIPNLKIIYILYLINTVSTYYTAYKEVLITADQKSYLLTKINVFYAFLLNSLQIIVLFVFKNFIIYLIVQFFIQIMQKININMKISKLYPKVDFNSKEKVDNETLGDIKKNVKAMVVHKIGDYCINGTDNIIISSFISVIIVGIYSNYLLIITTLNNIVGMIYNSITASFGNLLVANDKSKSEKIFKKIDFFSYILYSYFGLIFISCLNPVIKVWIGDEYLLSKFTVLLISFSFFLTGTRTAITIVRNSAGQYDRDKYIPLFQSGINIIVSIVGAKFWGINGVILGTIMSSILPCIYRPYIVYTHVFKLEYSKYLKETYLKYISLFIINALVMYFITNKLFFSNIIVEFLVCGIIPVIINTISILIFFWKEEEFKYVLDMIKNIFYKIIKKKGNKNEA